MVFVRYVIKYLSGHVDGSAPSSVRCSGNAVSCVSVSDFWLKNGDPVTIGYAHSAQFVVGTEFVTAFPQFIHLLIGCLILGFKVIEEGASEVLIPFLMLLISVQVFFTFFFTGKDFFILIAEPVLLWDKR